ncbi:MAG TPA: hypothetical protein VGC30_04625 [Dokdonella sp.]
MLEFPRAFPADAVEREIADVAAARAVLGARLAPLDAALARRRDDFAALLGDRSAAALYACVEDAVRLAYARLARRHGRLGGDFHAYHNEQHALDLCDGRLGRVCATLGAHALALRDWCALLVFGAGHDLRQREAPLLHAGIGANERASAEETQRILTACGVPPERDPELHLVIEIAIAGSTFDARVPRPGQAYNAADLVQSGGALADRLDRTLDALAPRWRADAHFAHRLGLARIAADLDTANVAEPFARFAQSGEDLCREREMLAGRSTAAADSALPVLGFLTDGQHRFFFELHRFLSEAGRAAFGAGKQANAPKLKALAAGTRARLAVRGRPASGDDVIAAYRATLADLCEVERGAGGAA